MEAKLQRRDRVKPRLKCRIWTFNNIKLFVLCHGMLQCAQLLYSAYFKSSIVTIEKQFGLSSLSSGFISSLHEIGNSLLIVFVSYFGSRVHRPKLIGIGGLLLSFGAFLLTLPHFISGRYEYSTATVGNASYPNSDTCQPVNQTRSLEYCSKSDIGYNTMSSVWVIIIIAQLIVGIGTVPIQPFGISYVDDFAEPSNSALYIAILFAISVFGPSFGYLLGSLMLRLFVDFNRVNPATIDLKPSDPRWIGAWWLGLLISSSILAIISVPYFFFPRKITPEKKSGSESDMLSETEEQKMQEMTIREFIKMFPKMIIRLLLNPLFIIIVLAQCSFSSVLAGISTYLNKFLETQYSTTISYANLLIGSITLPALAIGMVLGGLFMKRFNMSLVKIPWFASCILTVVIILTIPLFFMGCSTQKIAGINYIEDVNRSSSFSLKADCNAHCFCFDYTYNPVCGVDGIEYMSPCQAGCTDSVFHHSTRMILAYNNCSCIQTSNNEDYAHPGHCKVSCSYLLLSMVFSISFIGMVASLTHNPLYMTVLRAVRQEEKSFAIGIQFLIMRMFAWLPAPALFGAVIDSTCISWHKTCTGKRGKCNYYDNNLLRKMYLGLQVVYNILGILLLLIGGWKAKIFSARQVAAQKTEAV
ncbi:solute carrier organic anion transporter family member 2A1-like isoform X1 [Scyliorhinus canicula]|uniref:solute carrier organic anion transporter family member 2A1-like isoform X1 n=1 Tax=Scyliorhinus canicula TaxID=7830 RepID=UPI0018F35CEF|nr:solute carrier organic anion transporter family member 2A1-like isoform X1 [Scyliorhinus canicula]